MALGDVPPQLIEAIECASSPQSSYELKSQALNFLDQVKTNSQDTWNICLSLFLNKTSNLQGRMWSLTVIDDLLENKFSLLKNEDIELIRSSLLEFVNLTYVQGSEDSNLTYIKNILAHTLTLFILHTYEDSNNGDLIVEFLNLVKIDNSAALNFNLLSLVLNILKEINLELSDNIIKSAREFTPERNSRDGHLRDLIRSKCSSKVIETLLNIMDLLNFKFSSDADHQNNLIIDNLQLSINVFAGWTHWVDISLSFTPRTLELFYNYLQFPDHSVKISSNNYFIKIVQKGIQDNQSKLNILNILNLHNTFNEIEANSRNDESLENDQFRESCAKVINAAGLEILKLCEDNVDINVRSQAIILLSQIQLIFLRYLEDKNLNTSLSVHHLLSTLISFYKKKKKVDELSFNSSSLREFLSRLLPIIMNKMQWNDNVEWGFGGIEEDEDEDRNQFNEIRRVLRSSFDSVYQLDNELWMSSTITLINSTLNQISISGANSIPWYQAELVLYIVFLFAEALQCGNSIQSLVEVSEQEKLLNKKDNDFKILYDQKPLSPLGQLIETVIKSGIINHDHPAVSLQYFEMIVRYSEIINARKELIEPILSAFVGPKGIHNQYINVKARNCYLLQRLTQLIKKYIPIDFIPNLIESMSDMLNLKVELAEIENENEDILTKSVNKLGIFQSQLDLFECIGRILTLLNNNGNENNSNKIENQLNCLNMIIQPILKDTYDNINKSSDIESILKVHHNILAIGSLSKGLSESTSSNSNEIPQFTPLLRNIVECLFLTLQQLSELKVIRDCSRFTFSQIVSCTGDGVIDHIPVFVQGLLEKLDKNELSEFLTFICMLIHKLKSKLYDILNIILIPIINKVSLNILQENINQGTDDIISTNEIEKNYLNFISSILSYGLQGILINDQSILIQIMESVCLLISKSTAINKRIGYSNLSKFVYIFGTIENVQIDLNVNSNLNAIPTLTPPPLPLKGFEEFIYNNFIKLAFEVPAKPDFNIKDGQSLLVSFSFCFNNEVQFTYCLLRYWEKFQHF